MCRGCAPWTRRASLESGVPYGASGDLTGLDVADGDLDLTGHEGEDELVAIAEEEGPVLPVDAEFLGEGVGEGVEGEFDWLWGRGGGGDEEGVDLGEIEP